MPTEHTDVHLAIIGGSGLYNLEGLQVVDEVYPQTPWGYPADKILIGRLSAVGPKVAFLARHGRRHQFSPSEVPNRANIAALKHLGVQAVIAFSAVGSLREDIRPGDFVLPDQIVDRTKGVRDHTFFEGGVLAHASFADPFHPPLADLIAQDAAPCLTNPTILRTAATSTAGAVGEGAAAANEKQQATEAVAKEAVEPPRLHRGKTVVTIEGPAFSTRAESHLYRAWNCDVVNMTAVPEAKLAREAEMAYQMVCMSTDYDCWREGDEGVSVSAVMAVMQRNALHAQAMILAILHAFEANPTIAHQRLREATVAARGSMANAIMTPPDHRDPEVTQRLHYILPDYFPLPASP
ncbi:S-methyl-5-thioadenosine phosphorylase [Tieghemiomyces parasiticus]|uniref:S-methyl-5'-thioadenosine phosphorylase n=1 Tax=Tieghemiomyces parasiticus TaxID=78921 RepID=A0A9W7ZKZ7_9FUNG|nr:S-methyl-5-thioadenosine phosphorylase [Tieghemiomyces parasiticus]